MKWTIKVYSLLYLDLVIELKKMQQKRLKVNFLDDDDDDSSIALQK